MKPFLFAAILTGALFLTGAGTVANVLVKTMSTDKDEVVRSKIMATGEIIDKVWAGNPVRFGIVTSSKAVYVGYYDFRRRLTLAQRNIGGGAWSYTRLDTITNWDSHRSINLAVDNSGRLHVAANMHASPLYYYMSNTSGEASSLKRVPFLVDRQTEKSMTYPVYLRDQQNRLILKYRDGRSGNGNEIYDVFDDKTAIWSHLTPTPIVDGQNQRSAYFVGPKRGPDGWYHMAWVWCESIQYESAHDLSYARSRDLVHWEKADGTALTLPITLSSSEIIAPVKQRSGLVSGPPGFDAQKRVMIAFHTYDSKGQSQVYLARHEGSGWHVVQASQWQKYRWTIVSGGTIPFEVEISSPGQIGNDIVIPVTRQNKQMVLHLRADNLMPIGEVDDDTLQSASNTLGMTIPSGMVMNRVGATQGGKSYVIAWTSEPSNRDKPRDVAPPASKLILFRPTGSVETPER